MIMKTTGNVALHWLLYFDVQGTNRVGWGRFSNEADRLLALHRIPQGLLPPKSLTTEEKGEISARAWVFLDAEHDGNITLEEVCPEVGRVLAKFRHWCKEHFNSVSELFLRLNVDENQGGEVSFLTLRTACKRIADPRFRLNDLQRLITEVVEPIQKFHENRFRGGVRYEDIAFLESWDEESTTTCRHTLMLTNAAYFRSGSKAQQSKADSELVARMAAGGGGTQVAGAPLEVDEENLPNWHHALKDRPSSYGGGVVQGKPPPTGTAVEAFPLSQHQMLEQNEGALPFALSYCCGAKEADTAMEILSRREDTIGGGQGTRGTTSAGGRGPSGGIIGTSSTTRSASGPTRRPGTAEIVRIYGAAPGTRGTVNFSKTENQSFRRAESSRAASRQRQRIYTATGSSRPKRNPFSTGSSRLFLEPFPVGPDRPRTGDYERHRKNQPSWLRYSGLDEAFPAPLHPVPTSLEIGPVPRQKEEARQIWQDIHGVMPGEVQYFFYSRYSPSFDVTMYTPLDTSRTTNCLIRRTNVRFFCERCTVCGSGQCV